MSDDNEQEMDVYSGVRWSALARYSVQGLDVVISLYVARIVAPEAYGLLGMAIVMTGFLQTFQTLGFGSAIIQRKEINQSLLSSLFYFNLVFCSLLAAGLVCTSPLISWVYSDARVGQIVAVLSITFLLSAPGLVPTSLLTRQMAFKRLAYVDIAVCIVRGATAVALALAGWGVWALVWCTIAGTAVHTPLLYIASRWRPQWHFRWSDIQSVLGFGANLTGFSIFNYFARNADKFIIGAFLGATPLGYYSLAYRILLFPRDAVSGVLTRVLFPAFCRMQDDDERLKQAYLRACGCIAFITFPMMTGFTVIAGLFVNTALGDKWAPALPLLYVLAPLGALQSLWTTVGQLFLAKGRADWYFRWGLAMGGVFVCSFLVGLPWGVFGVALSYCVVCTPWAVFSFWLAFRLVDGLRLRDLAREVIPYAGMSATMAALVLACLLMLESLGSPALLTLVLCVLVGVASYAALSLITRPPAVCEMLRLLPTGLAAWFSRDGGPSVATNSACCREEQEASQIPIENCSTGKELSM